MLTFLWFIMLIKEVKRMQFELLLYVVVGVLLNVISNLIAEWIIRYIKRRKRKKNSTNDR